MNQKIQTAKMLALVAEKFKDKFDKAGEPYFYHCYAVMEGLGVNATEEQKQIALGHDLLEDTDVTKQQLRDMGFTEHVIDCINLLTKHRGQTYEEYVFCVTKENDTVLVKMSDLTHNSDIRRIKGEPDQKDFERTKKYRVFYHELKKIAIAKGLL